MIIEEKKEIPESGSNTRIKIAAVLILLLLIIASYISAIYARTLVSVGLSVFAGICAIALHVLLASFEFWKQHRWKLAFSPFIIFLVWLPAIFGFSKLRSDYEVRLLSRAGIAADGKVIDVFKERRNRGLSKYKLFARLEFKASQKTIHVKTINPDHYLNVDDTVKLIYAVTDPDVFRIMAVKRFLPAFATARDAQAYQPIISKEAAWKQPQGKMDSPPQFKGGMTGFANYLRDALEYPLEAQDKHITGKVFLSFVIQEDGSIADVQVVKGLGNGCDEAAVKAIRNSPAWLPGMQNGKAVRVKYNLPVSFSLW